MSHFTLPQLPYSYDALTPYIDAKTMKIHHTKHHNGYTNKLNAAIEGTDLEGKSIEEILGSLDMTNSAVRNNGGGYYNHRLFWEVIAPEDRGRLSGELSDAVKEAYGYFALSGSCISILIAFRSSIGLFLIFDS